jgi:uncharacterized damage-inducible protein DinB
MSKALADCLRYNRWASLSLIDACRGLTEEQLDTRATRSSRSVRELLQHIVGSELTFVLRTKGRQHEGESRYVEATWPGLDVLQEVAASSGDELIAIAAGLDEDGLVALPYQGKTFEYPRSFFLLHAIEHGVEHRTEIKVTLALIGIATPDLDGWLYAPAAGYGREIETDDAGATGSGEREFES